MRLYIVAVGTRMPRWVGEGFDEFVRRMPRELPVELIEIKPEPRTSGKTVEALMAAECSRIRAALPARCKWIVLDERGDDVSTRQLAHYLDDWRQTGDDVAFVIGGPDGLDSALKAQAHARLRLSGLTLPHAMVRVLLAEALYRAWSLTQNHPYHRE